MTFAIKSDADISYLDPDLIETTTEGRIACSEARVEDIDFEATKKLSLTNHLEEYYKIRKIIGDEHAALLTKRSQMQSDEAYIQQPNAIPILENLRKNHDRLYTNAQDILNILTQTGDEYANARYDFSSSWLPYFILHNGQWREYDGSRDEDNRAAWADYVLSFLKSLPGETLITSINCHC